LRPSVIRPIERDYGSATSGANEAASARGLLGTKESGGENRARAAGNAEGGQGETEEASGLRRGERSLTRLVCWPRCRGKVRAEYLIVDGHSVIFAWPELRKLHARRTSLAREALTKKLRDYQDWTGTRVAVVFDGKGQSVTVSSDPGEIQIFYSREGQTADSIIERLASKYGERFKLLVATSDVLEQETASACGAECISAEALRWLLDDGRPK
jgi:predicted RNA-binding protein with PIN domain